MQSGPYEYKNIKRLEVRYPEYNDKHEYHEPILCRARDMGKVIYGKWIIGGEQWSFFSEEPYSDDEEKLYTAYKLVFGAKIICNFELEEGKVPCTTFVGFTNPVETPPPQDAERLYIVDKAINNVCGEPETEVLENGLIYIKMPSEKDAANGMIINNKAEVEESKTITGVEGEIQIMMNKLLNSMRVAATVLQTAKETGISVTETLNDLCQITKAYKEALAEATAEMRHYQKL